MANFKTRARTIDMLGRQQIAGAPTAISELFKNAHDAYADNAEVDFFREDNLLVVRDDGVGMTKDEFENRWLVLGTENKIGKNITSGNNYRPPGKARREVLGEKGIGRLAIAVLGRQVLVLTRAIRNGESGELVMSFIHWGLFELPGLNLEDIEIPIHTVAPGTLPSKKQIAALLAENQKLLQRLKSRTAPPIQKQIQKISSELDDVQIDPVNLDAFLGGRTLKGTGHGTHFFILPANESILAEIEGERGARRKDFSKFLLGFSNATFLDTTNPPIKTALRYWPSDTESEDLISEGEFFLPSELETADHRVTGVIDEFGQFKGTVRVYEEESKDHIISWAGASGKPTSCGPFAVEFGYVHGEARVSRLPADDWARMDRKLENLGGLYVYRDRIRILPYGNSDVDWLEIELRRNKGAAHYFFSYRRMFGAVCITRAHNEALHEKAGREGFQQDKAYRQLKAILENLLVQLAADFFRKDGDNADFFQHRKSELERLELARRKREKQVTTKRKNLAASLESFFQLSSQKLPETELDELGRHINQRMEAAARMPNPDEASVALLDAEREANRRLSEIRGKYCVQRPRGVGMSRPLQRDWDAYQSEQVRLEQEVFAPFAAATADTLGKMASQARIYVDQRRRLEQLINQVADTKRKAVRTEAVKLRETAGETRRAAVNTAHDAIRQLQNTIAGVQADFARQDFASLPTEQIEQIRRDFETRIDEVGTRNTETLSKVRDMLATIAENLEQGIDVSQLEMMEAMDEELQGLREQTDADAELVQLGLAVAVINHEFEAAIKGIRGTLRQLHSWANANEALTPLYQEIRNNFDHLDGHLNLFTPLQRRLYRNPIKIKGADIHHYVKALFDVRLKRHNIDIVASDAFLATNVDGYPSTLYPVFVNILDNAIFWLRDVSGKNDIKLDADSQSFLIGNNGPAIHKRDYESIFDQGFSRKPGGRGLGLFISRKALRKEGMDLSVVPSNSNKGVTFRLDWPKNE
ncbi:MAG: ATP-binding protein [Sterolibacterium sp.]